VTLSIIIINWNSLEYLRDCLASIYRETKDVNFELIVVDNNSQDDCTVLLDEFPTMRLIQAGKNLGFARANNLAFQQSNGELLLFLNPDTELTSDSLSTMAHYLQAHSEVGAVGARLLNSDGSVQTSCVQAFPTIWNQIVDCELLRKGFPESRLWGTRALTEGGSPDAEVISGACFLVKRAIFEEVGHFGEEYFMYADDLDLSYKIKSAGYEIHCLRNCTVVHHGGKSSAQRVDNFSDVIQRNSIAIFLKKTRGPRYALAYRNAIAAVACTRLVLTLCMAPFSRSRLLRKKSPRSVAQKWTNILRWAIGFNSTPALLHDDSARSL
jgi:GT2 family glycosyltransferase